MSFTLHNSPSPPRPTRITIYIRKLYKVIFPVSMHHFFFSTSSHYSQSRSKLLIRTMCSLHVVNDWKLRVKWSLKVCWNDVRPAPSHGARRDLLNNEATHAFAECILARGGTNDSVYIIVSCLINPTKRARVTSNKRGMSERTPLDLCVYMSGECVLWVWGKCVCVCETEYLASGGSGEDRGGPTCASLDHLLSSCAAGCCCLPPSRPRLAGWPGPRRSLPTPHSHPLRCLLTTLTFFNTRVCRGFSFFFIQMQNVASVFVQMFYLYVYIYFFLVELTVWFHGQFVSSSNQYSAIFFLFFFADRSYGWLSLSLSLDIHDRINAHTYAHTAHTYIHTHTQVD